MGDHFQVLADVDAGEAEAPALAASLVEWLVRDGVITSDVTDCVLGAEHGYPPGPNFWAVVNQPNERFLSLRTNGVEISIERRVFYPGQGDFGAVDCPSCGQTVILSDPSTGAVSDHWERFGEALSTWYAGGSDLVRCPYCDQLVRFNDWRWSDEPFALGFLGLTFWNWPELSDWFVEQLARHLGHRVIRTGGKL
jgi:uncharacterized Zn-finger protein